MDHHSNERVGLTTSNDMSKYTGIARLWSSRGLNNLLLLGLLAVGIGTLVVSLVSLRIQMKEPLYQSYLDIDVQYISSSPPHPRVMGLLITNRHASQSAIINGVAAIYEDTPVCGNYPNLTVEGDVYRPHPDLPNFPFIRLPVAFPIEIRPSETVGYQETWRIKIPANVMLNISPYREANPTGKSSHGGTLIGLCVLAGDEEPIRHMFEPIGKGPWD